MCRLAHITTRFDAIGDWFLDLEKSFGGDGNGIAIGKRVVKGLTVTGRTIEQLVRRSLKPALFHTRKSSIGGRASTLCHPFQCDHGWLVHNGHWQLGANYAYMFQLEYGGKIRSDTEVMSNLVDRWGFSGAMAKLHPCGVWLWQDYSGRLSVHKSGGDLWYCSKLRSWGSEPAAEGVWYEVADGDYAPGQVPDRVPPRITQVAGFFHGKFDGDDGPIIGNRWAWQRTALPAVTPIKSH